MNHPLVTVIMPARNAAPYIREAIDSVVKQTWQNWELLVIDNGSTDNTAALAKSFNDPRIMVHYEEKIGISNARNCGLRNAKGNYFCFLDADDRFTAESIECRMKLLLSDDTLEFADGWVEYWNVDFSVLKRTCKPTLRGVPFMEVASLNPSCLCAVSWMIRMIPGKRYSFDQPWTHSEDIAFFLLISRTGNYNYVDQPTYQVRRGHASTMTNLKGLEDGYYSLLDHVSHLEGIPDGHQYFLRNKIRSIITKTYLKKMKLVSAVKAWTRFSSPQ